MYLKFELRSEYLHANTSESWGHGIPPRPPIGQKDNTQLGQGEETEEKVLCACT